MRESSHLVVYCTIVQRFNDLKESLLDVEISYHVPQPLFLDSVKCLFKIDEVVVEILLVR